MRTLTTVSIVLLLAALLAPARAARAEGDPLERALALRNASSKDFEAKNYRAAAEKLRRAAAIYEALEEPPAAELAITLRALIWNEYHDSQLEALVADLLRLQRLAARHPNLTHELDSAISAQWQAAKAQPTLEQGEAILKPLLEAAYNLDQARIAGQTLHNLGSLARDKGDFKRSIDYYERAIKKRREIPDWVGMGWTWNNLANVHLVHRNDVLAALEPLERAHELIHSQGVLAPQGAVAWNLKDALARITRLLEASGKPLPDETEDWLKRVLNRTTLTNTGTHVSYARLARQWLAWSVSSGDADRIEAVALSIVGLRDKNAPAAVRADLVLRASKAVLDAGRPKTAARWLERLEPGSGPCAGHLAARRKTLEARILATARPTHDKVAAAAKAAFALWSAMDDRRGQKDAYAALVGAATEAGVAEELAEIQKALDELLAEGVPGGPGGFATASGNVEKMSRLEADDALFMIRKVEGGIEVADLATGADHVIEVKWVPMNVGFNGLSLTLFGGYVVVNKLAYGGAASADGSLGETTLDEFGDYWPVPGVGALVVQKNGAVRYRRK